MMIWQLPPLRLLVEDQSIAETDIIVHQQVDSTANGKTYLTDEEKGHWGYENICNISTGIRITYMVLCGYLQGNDCTFKNWNNN